MPQIVSEKENRLRQPVKIKTAFWELLMFASSVSSDTVLCQ